MLISLADIVSKYGIDLGGVLHIGAHEGEEAESYSSLGAKRVLWVEGNPGLEKNLTEKLSKYNNQKAIIALVSDKDDQVVDFHMASDLQASSILAAKDVNIFHESIKFDRSVELKTSRLETLFDSDSELGKDLHFLNLDIQGSELLAILGLGKYLEQFNYIYTEINLVEIYSGNPKLTDLDKYLGKKGFIRKELELTGLGWGDAFYVRQSQVGKIELMAKLVEARMLQWQAYLSKVKLLIKKTVFTR